MTYVHVVHGWVWKRGQQVGGNANWPCLGGSSGGDDQHEVLCKRLKVKKVILHTILLGVGGFIYTSHTLNHLWP